MLFITFPCLNTWKFVPFDLLHPFHLPPSPSLATTNLFSVSMKFFFFRSHVEMRSYGVCLLVSSNALKVSFVSNGKISIFFID